MLARFSLEPYDKSFGKNFSVPKMASPEARKILNPELLSKYRCVPKIGFGFKFGFEKGFRYKTLFFYPRFAGFLLIFADNAPALSSGIAFKVSLCT